MLQPYGTYLLVRKLTEGGMAEIFLAKQLGAEGFERDVVIKRLLPQLSEVPEFVRMFLDEARLAARLSHPNIVQIHDLGKAEDRYFIAMEYLAGEDFSSTLRTLARAGRYTPLPVVLQVLSEAARGLHHAHEFQDESGAPLGIVHRDISPSNLHLTYQGQVKVLDFGIAWAQTRLTKTQAGVVKGKYSYMAPEQARGEQVDRRADVYSLGVSLYEGLTNIRPLVRENDLAMLNAVLTGDYAPPRQHRPELPEALEAVALRAMALKPEDRFPSAGAFADALDALLPEVGGAMSLGAFLRESFGEERFVERTRIPSLETLRGGAPTAAFPAPVLGSEIPTVAGRTGKTPISRLGASAPVASAPVPSAAPPVATGEGRGRARWVAAAAALMLVVGSLAWWAGRAGSGAAPAQVTEAPATPPAAPDVPPKGAALPAPGGAPEGATGTDPEPTRVAGLHVGGEEPADATAEPEDGKPAPVAPEVTAPAKPTAPRPPPRLETLTMASIERVVTRGESRFFACFERFKAELPSESGELQIRITILGSGRARGEVEGPLRAGQVGSCLSAAVQRLRFPAHKDKELQVAFPLNWRVAR